MGENFKLVLENQVLWCYIILEVCDIFCVREQAVESIVELHSPE